MLDGIVIIDSDSGLPLFSRLEEGIEETLFSATINAIRQFTQEMSLGGLSSFTTQQYSVFLAAQKRYITSIIASKEINNQIAYSLAYKIGQEFEERYGHIEFPQPSQFSDFQKITDEILSKQESPFLITVAEFIKKEYGGEVSINAEIVNRNNEKVSIDVVSDRGKKKLSLRDKLVTKVLPQFSADIIFVKVFDRVAGRSEVRDFLDSLQNFGAPHHFQFQKLEKIMKGKKIPHFPAFCDKCEKEASEIFPYFPAYAVIIARDYSPTILEELESLSRSENKAYIGGTHLLPTADRKKAPPSSRCFVEVWKIEEKKYPELIFK